MYLDVRSYYQIKCIEKIGHRRPIKTGVFINISANIMQRVKRYLKCICIFGQLIKALEIDYIIYSRLHYFMV